MDSSIAVFHFPHVIIGGSHDQRMEDAQSKEEILTSRDAVELSINEKLQKVPVTRFR